MKKSVFLPVLTILLAAVILLCAAFGLNGLRVRRAREAHLDTMKTLLPGSETFTLEPYAGEDPMIRSVHKGETGFVIETVTYGYAGDITLLVSVSNGGKVMGITVRDLHETPGLGAEALSDYEFLAQFLNKTGNFEVKTNGADAFSGATGEPEAPAGDVLQVDGITGATVTSKAIARCVNSAVAYVTGADVSSSATFWGG